MKFQKIALLSFSIFIGFFIVVTVFGQSNRSRRGSDYVLISDTSGKLFVYDIKRGGRPETYAEFLFSSCSDPSKESVGNFDIQYLDRRHLIIANWECGAIYKFNLRTKELSLISKELFIKPIGIAVSKKEGGIYYIADQERGILAYNARDGSVEILLEGWNPDGIALSPSGGIYFTRGDEYIYRVSLDGLPEAVRYLPSLELNGIVFASPDSIVAASIDSYGSHYGSIISTFRNFQNAFDLYFEPPLNCPQIRLRDPEDVAIDRNGDIYIIDSDFQGAFPDHRPGLYRLPRGSECLDTLWEGEPFLDPVDILLYSISGRRGH